MPTRARLQYIRGSGELQVDGCLMFFCGCSPLRNRKAGDGVEEVACLSPSLILMCHYASARFTNPVAATWVPGLEITPLIVCSPSSRLRGLSYARAIEAARGKATCGWCHSGVPAFAGMSGPESRSGYRVAPHPCLGVDLRSALD